MVGLRARLVALLVGVMVLAFVLLLVGVNFGLRADVHNLAQQRVDAGEAALSGAMDARVESVRSTVLQGSAETSLASALQSRNREALQSAASDIAVSGNLSFVVVTDAAGNVLAGSRAASGTLGKNQVVTGAAVGAVTGGLQLLDGPDLRALGVTAQAPALAIGMASPINVAGKAVGVLYGGTLVDASMKAVDDVSRFTGGETGVAVNGTLVATSMSTKEGVKETGTAVGDYTDVAANRQTFSGVQTVDNLAYFVKMAPLTSYDGKVVGAYWFGVPYAQFEAIVGNTLRQIVLWGLLGLIISAIAGAFFASRIGRAISRRSEEVNESAKQLRVLVVGGEVSGDHVVRTRETLEEIKSLVERGNDSGEGALRTLTSRAVDDVVVIDTLTAELSSRMRDAATRVERLSAVAQELDELVAGARPSRN